MYMYQLKGGIGQKNVLLEVGCGVGNAFFPLLEEIPNMYVHACDFSPRAIQFVKVSTFIYFSTVRL